MSGERTGYDVAAFARRRPITPDGMDAQEAAFHRARAGAATEQATGLPMTEHAQAIADMLFYRRTHVQWAEYFEAHPAIEARYVATGAWSTAAQHRQIVAAYDRVLRLLGHVSPVAPVLPGVGTDGTEVRCERTGWVRTCRAVIPPCADCPARTGERTASAEEGRPSLPPRERRHDAS